MKRRFRATVTKGTNLRPTPDDDPGAPTFQAVPVPIDGGRPPRVRGRGATAAGSIAVLRQALAFLYGPLGYELAIPAGRA